MKNKAILRCMLAGAVAISAASPAFAQTALGGSKPQQNKIGGAAKPAPVVGGATIHTPSPAVSPKPAATVAITKPGSPGGTPTPGTLGTSTPGQTISAANSRLNPPPTIQPKSTKSANLKCASGACTARGAKP